MQTRLDGVTEPEPTWVLPCSRISWAEAAVAASKQQIRMMRKIMGLAARLR